MPIGTNYWNYRSCGVNSSSTLCSFASSNRTITILAFTTVSESYPNNSFEGKTETFQINVSTTNLTVTTGNLIYNGTSYTGTITSLGGSNYSITRSIDIPLITRVVQNVSFYWNIGSDLGSAHSTVRNISVEQINFGICNSTYTKKVVNFSFKDESSLSFINATIDLASFTYGIPSSSITKDYTFVNATHNIEYNFCVYPSSIENLSITGSIQYAHSGTTTYPQRKRVVSQTYSNSSITNNILYLLPSTDGIYVTFQVINSAEQPLNNVIANATRQISGTDEIVGQGTTGADGGITFWLNPNFMHNFYFLLDPYPLYLTSLTPTQTSYTITLGSVTTSNFTDYTKGITYSVKPTSTYLENGTLYGFNFTISSSYWDLDSYGFNLTNEDGTLIGTASGTGNSGTINLDKNTGQNETFVITYYWIINGTTTQASKSWVILDLSGNTFSIYHLLTDFKTYIGLGLFGLTDFGVGIICFLIIILVTGTLKLKYGISNDSVICGIIFGLVALLDVSFGLIPNPVGAVPNFPTIFVGIIFAGFIFKEVFQ
jgi:hypothetical protein